MPRRFGDLSKVDDVAVLESEELLQGCERSSATLTPTFSSFSLEKTSARLAE